MKLSAFKKSKKYAWHFVGKTLRDGSPIPADGVRLKFHDTPILCEQGYHASRQPFDALQFAPGETLCLVKIGGKVIEDTDKLVCTERTILARFDATEMLRYFSRMQGIAALEYWDTEPPCVVLDYLATGDEELRAAARDAVRAAASDAAWDAAWDAARDAQREHFNGLVYECFAGPIENIRGEL